LKSVGLVYGGKETGILTLKIGSDMGNPSGKCGNWGKRLKRLGVAKMT
jgi:hypothetical protein